MNPVREATLRIRSFIRIQDLSNWLDVRRDLRRGGHGGPPLRVRWLLLRYGLSFGVEDDDLAKLQFTHTRLDLGKIADQY